MDLKEMQSKIEQIVTSAIKSGQGTEEIIEKETEKVAKDFFAKNSERSAEIQKSIFAVIKDVKGKTGDNKQAITGVAKGMLKGAQEGARLSIATAKDVAESLVKECVSIGLDLKEIPKLLFQNFKNTFMK